MRAESIYDFPFMFSQSKAGRPYSSSSETE